MNHRALLFSSLCLLIAVLARVADGQSWDRFRGPGGAGECEATTIPATWNTEDYKWRVKLPGVGHSSPVVRGQKIFVTCGEQATAARITRCLDTSDGGLVWKRSFPSEHHGMNNFNSYGSSTPALDNDHVYMTWATPDEYIVVALDQAKGDELWRRDLGPFQGEHGHGASPMVFENMLVVTNDQDGQSFAIALDCTSGKTRWKAPRRTEVAAYSTPCIFQPEGQPPQLILTSWANGITSLDPRSGNKNWELPILNHRVVCSPVIAGGLIFTSCGSGGGGKQMVAVRPGIPGRGIEAALAYEIEGSLPYVPTSVAHGQLLFLWSDSGVVTCLDAPTGDVHWRERVGGQYFGSPVRVADRIYCISRKGEMVVLAAADKFKLLARIDLEEPSQATPAIADGVMYLRTESHLMALSQSTAHEVPSALDRQCVPQQGVVYHVAGSWIFRTSNPGPAQGGTSTAWRLANEFVYRTALGAEYTLPASYAGADGDEYIVRFTHKRTQKRISIGVNIQTRTATLH